MNGIESSFIPAGTQCVDCPSPMAVYGATAAGATKVASIGFGVSQASKDCVGRAESEFIEWGPANGIEFVYKNDDLPFGLPNGLGPEVTAMKDAGVDYVTTCVDQNSALALAQELERQGMSDVVVALPQGYGDAAFFADNAALLEGDSISIPYRPIEADQGDSIIPTMLEWFETSGITVNDYAIQGWMGADLAVTGLLAAGPQFDQASVVAATNEITDYDAGGLVPPVDWTTAHTARTADEPATMCAAFLRVVGGVLEMSTDPAEPFTCFDLPMAEWTAPTQVSFD